MKVIIPIWNTAQKGKTETLRELAKLLINNYPNYTLIHPKPINIIHKSDFRLIIEINGKVIGIESQGDPSTNLKKRLEDIVTKYNCDIIFCATRTRGDTIHAVNNIAKKYNYEKIWNSTYEISVSSLRNQANQIKAKHLVDLIVQLKLI